MALLCPVARSIFDQFARISVKAKTSWHDQVLDSLEWSSRTTVKLFRDLPILRNDLFGSKFNVKLGQETEWLQALREADDNNVCNYLLN